MQNMQNYKFQWIYVDKKYINEESYDIFTKIKADFT